MKLLSGFLLSLVMFSCGSPAEKTADVKTDSSAPASTPDSSAHHETAARPYQFEIPQGWTTELIPFPIDFAPGIAFKGVEDLRFPPGWGKPENEEHWSYMFLWWVEGEQFPYKGMLEDYFTQYYSGLVGRNITERKIPKEKVVPTKVSFKKLVPDIGDKETYEGTVDMLNYMTQSPIKLNLRVHVPECKAEGHTAIFTVVSPQPQGHRIWKELEQLVLKFKCSAK